jgi:hypothetical protein
MSREVVPLLPDGVQRHIGSFNRLFPDFHGTVSEMEMIWDGFESRLRELRPGAMENYEDPKIDIAKHTVPVSWDADKELPVWCSVQLQGTDDGVERLAVVVETRHSQVKCGMYKAWRTNLDDPDKLQHFKRSLAAAAKFMADYRPCKGPNWQPDYRCGRHCVDGKDHCLRHWVGVPFQAAVDARAAKRQRT